MHHMQEQQNLHAEGTYNLHFQKTKILLSCNGRRQPIHLKSLSFHPENGRSRFLQNVQEFQPDYRTLSSYLKNIGSMFLLSTGKSLSDYTAVTHQRTIINTVTVTSATTSGFIARDCFCSVLVNNAGVKNQNGVMKDILMSFKQFMKNSLFSQDEKPNKVTYLSCINVWSVT